MNSVANADSLLDLAVLLCAAVGTVWFAFRNRAAQQSDDSEVVLPDERGSTEEDD